MDVLSSLINRGLKAKILSSFGDEKVALSHLQFADAMIFFCSGNDESFPILNICWSSLRQYQGLRLIGAKVKSWPLIPIKRKSGAWQRKLVVKLDPFSFPT